MDAHSGLKTRLSIYPTTRGHILVDAHFAQCHSITVLERYSEPGQMVSTRLEADKNAFFGRNPTKYTHSMSVHYDQNIVLHRS
jgi:hypothetical protein